MLTNTDAIDRVGWSSADRKAASAAPGVRARAEETVKSDHQRDGRGVGDGHDRSDDRARPEPEQDRGRPDDLAAHDAAQPGFARTPG